MKRTIADHIPDALGLLLGLRGRLFEWDEDAHAAVLPGPQYGLYAEETQQALPQWVYTTPDGTLILQPIGFEALVVEALREIVTRLDALGG